MGRRRKAASQPKGKRSEAATFKLDDELFQDGDVDACSSLPPSMEAAPLPMEAISLLATDLPSLPNVQRLLSDHLHRFEASVRRMLPQASMYDIARQELAKLPDVQAFFLEHLDHFPEWRQSIEARMPNFNWQSMSLGEVFEQHGPPRWVSFPPTLIEKFRSLPSAQEVFSNSLSSFESLSNDAMRTLAAPLASMPDVHHLVAQHWDNLPDLQDLVHRHYVQATPDLKHYKCIPEWMQDNPMVHSGYRPELLSFQRCVRSLFYLHNESVNVYTHLIGGLVFLAAAVAGIYYFSDIHWADQFSLLVFHTGALLCLFGSATFHLFWCHSEHWGRWFNKLDYFGITAMISGSTISVEYFTFFCNPTLMAFYVSLTAIFSVVCGALSFSNAYRTPDTRHVRVFLFIALAVTGLIPMVHYSALYGWEHFARSVDVTWIGIVSGPCYLLGALVYVKRFPECYLPGKFDLWLHSHQLWHCFVLAAAVAHYLGVLNMLHFRREHGCSFENEIYPGISA